VYKPAVEAYGLAVGIVLLDANVPFIPGDVGNANSFRYPVLYRTVPGLTRKECVDNPQAWTGAVVEAALALERQGVRAIAGSSGAMIHFQDSVAGAVKLPVCLSSLLQLPWIAAAFGPSRPIGVIAGDKGDASPKLLERFRLKPKNPIVVKGLQDQPGFRRGVLEEKGRLDSERIEAEVVRVAKRMAKESPKLAAILLEPAALPPYAKAVQAAVGLPVFDFVSLIDYTQSATHQPPVTGGYY
jgi:hypothetical protein